MTEETIFTEAMEIADPEARAAFLDRACSGNPDVRVRLDKLLAEHAEAGSFLGSPAPLLQATDIQNYVAEGGTQDIPAARGAGTTIGPYKLVEVIGEGGMGTVWLAQQQEPVKRLVALKVIKPGMDSKSVLARFEAERQALALMDHPNIAKVLEGGATPDGRPYFVMELVKGLPITKFCDERNLTPRQRLELFVPVCQAVQHAHQKGVIHRDLKPSNVLVALYDGRPVPKVIDFGIAKAAGQPLTEKTLITGLGTVVGTPEYMSPEQAELNQLDIDTRSDVYSLGILLYELLTGTTPLQHKRVKEAALLEVLRLVREEEPPRPSTRLSTTDELPSIAARRGTEPRKLSGLVRGELDWIVMKALEKDRNRRYETANGFAMDVQRYLADEAVQACPPSAGYRLRKFVRRNKGPVLAVSLLALALVGGVIGTTWGMLRATFAEAEAVREAGEKTVALRERTAALGEKETALAAAKANENQAKAAQKDAQENLKDALAAVDQMLTRVAEDKLQYVPQMEPIRRELLLDALKFYQKFLDKQNDDPVIRREATLAHRRVGGIHRWLGQPKEAERAFRNAIELFDKPGPSGFADPALLREMVNCHIELSWALNVLGQADEAGQNIRSAVELADKLDKQVPGNRRCLLNARNRLADILLSQKPVEAEKILNENLALADDAYTLGGVHRGLSLVYRSTGRLPQAEESARQALKYVEQYSAENPSANWVQATVANDQRALATVIGSQRPGESEEFQRRAGLIFEKLSTDFPNVPEYRQSLANALIEQAESLRQLGQMPDAEKAVRRAISIYEKLATDFPTVPVYWHSTFDQRVKLGQFLKEAGKIEEASRLYQDAGSMVSRLTTDIPTQLAHRVRLTQAHCELGRMLSAAGKKQEAEAEFRQVVSLSEKLEADFAGEPEHRRELAQCHMFAAEELRAARLYVDAERLYGWALQHYLALVREAPRAQQSQEELAHLHMRIGGFHLWDTRRLKDADRSYQAALEISDKLTLDFPETLAYRAWAAECRIQLGIVARREGRIQEAEQNLRQGIQLAEKVAKELPSDAWLRFYLGCGYRWLADVHHGAGSPQEVEKSLIQGLAVLDKLVAEFPNNDEYLAELSRICRSLSEHHFRNGQTEEGRRLNQRAVELSEPILAKKIVPYRKAIELQPKNPVGYQNLADFLSRQWKLDEAIAAYRDAIALDPNNAAYRPRLASALNNLGWRLATDPDPKNRDPARATKLAKEAVELAPDNWNFFNTLGAACYRAGDWKAAAAALEKSMELRKGGDSFDWFFLAMARWQLGNKDDARQWYDKAVVWMDKNHPTNDELLRFRAEATELLAIEMKQD